MAAVMDEAMEHMPQKDGSLKYQDEQNEEWCKNMPIGSSRVSQDWLKGRLARIKNGGNEVPH